MSTKFLKFLSLSSCLLNSNADSTAKLASLAKLHEFSSKWPSTAFQDIKKGSLDLFNQFQKRCKDVEPATCESVPYHTNSTGYTCYKINPRVPEEERKWGSATIGGIQASECDTASGTHTYHADRAVCYKGTYKESSKTLCPGSELVPPTHRLENSEQSYCCAGGVKQYTVNPDSGTTHGVKAPAGYGTELFGDREAYDPNGGGLCPLNGSEPTEDTLKKIPMYAAYMAMDSYKGWDAVKSDIIKTCDIDYVSTHEVVKSLGETECTSCEFQYESKDKSVKEKAYYLPGTYSEGYSCKSTTYCMGGLGKAGDANSVSWTNMWVNMEVSQKKPPDGSGEGSSEGTAVSDTATPKSTASSTTTSSPSIRRGLQHTMECTKREFTEVQGSFLKHTGYEFQSRMSCNEASCGRCKGMKPGAVSVSNQLECEDLGGSCSDPTIKHRIPCRTTSGATWTPAIWEELPEIRSYSKCTNPEGKTKAEKEEYVWSSKRSFREIGDRDRFMAEPILEADAVLAVLTSGMKKRIEHINEKIAKEDWDYPLKGPHMGAFLLGDGYTIDSYNDNRKACVSGATFLADGMAGKDTETAFAANLDYYQDVVKFASDVQSFVLNHAKALTEPFLMIKAPTKNDLCFGAMFGPMVRGGLMYDGGHAEAHLLVVDPFFMKTTKKVPAAFMGKGKMTMVGGVNGGNIQIGGSGNVEVYGVKNLNTGEITVDRDTGGEEIFIGGVENSGTIHVKSGSKATINLAKCNLGSKITIDSNATGSVEYPLEDSTCQGTVTNNGGSGFKVGVQLTEAGVTLAPGTKAVQVKSSVKTEESFETKDDSVPTSDNLIDSKAYTKAKQQGIATGLGLPTASITITGYKCTKKLREPEGNESGKRNLATVEATVETDFKAFVADESAATAVTATLASDTIASQIKAATNAAMANADFSNDETFKSAPSVTKTSKVEAGTKSDITVKKNSQAQVGETGFVDSNTASADATMRCYCKNGVLTGVLIAVLSLMYVAY